jgi:hypothetical protein
MKKIPPFCRYCKYLPTGRSEITCVLNNCTVNTRQKIKTITVYVALTALLWPLAVIITLMNLRIALTKHPKRLGLPDHIHVANRINRWCRAVHELTPLGRSVWLVDRARKGKQ